MLENLSTKGAMADIFVNGGLALNLVLKGDPKTRKLYLDFRNLEEIDTDGYATKQAKNDFIEGLTQFYTNYLNNAGKYIKIEGLPESVVRKVTKKFPIDKATLVKEAIEDVPFSETFGLLQLDLDDIKEDIKLDRESGSSLLFIEKGKRIITEDSISGLTDFDIYEDSKLGDLARSAVSSIYKQLFLRQLLNDTALKYELTLSDSQINLILPKINILNQAEVWQQFDQEIKPKLDCILKIQNLAILADKKPAEIENIITDFLKKNKTQLPSWFLSKYGLEPELPKLDKLESDSNRASVAEMRQQAEAREKEELLAKTIKLPLFSELSKEEAARTVRILSKFNIQTLKDVFEKLSADFKADGLTNLLKSYGASYTARESSLSDKDSQSVDREKTQKRQHSPFKLDYSEVEKDLNNQHASYRKRIEDFFSKRSCIEDLTSANVKRIAESKAFEYRMGVYRLYFVIEDHTIKFKRLRHKSEQGRDTSDMRKLYPK